MPRPLPTEPSPTDPSPADAPSSDAGGAEAKAAFHLRLRARGVRDLAVLRAFELTPRVHFVPPRYAELAARDLPLPLPCGQTSHESWLSARAVEALGVEAGHRVLEIGSGSGYVTAVLSRLAVEVMSLERFAVLAAAAQERLMGAGIANAAVVWGDGLALTPQAGRFDRILIHGAVDGPPPPIADRLAPGGRLLAAWTRAPGGQALSVWRDGGEPVALCPSRYAPLRAGLSAAL